MVRSRRSIERERKSKVAKKVQAEPKQVEKIDKNLLIAEKLTKLASAILAEEAEENGEDMKFVELKRELKTKINKLPNNIGNKSLKIVAPQLGSTLSLSQTKVSDLLQIILGLIGE